MVRNARFLKAAQARQTYFPVPLSGTFRIPPLALSVIVSVPVSLVAALGVNVTEIEQAAPAARLAGQLLVCMKTPGPASETISISTGTPGCFFLPLGLVTFTSFGLLVVATAVFENLTDFGLILSATATGVGDAVGVAVAVAPVEVAVAVAVAVLVAVAVTVGVPPVDVAVAVGVAVFVAVAVAVGVPLVDVAVAVAVAVLLAVGVDVAVAVLDAVAVEVAVAVAVAVG